MDFSREPVKRAMRNSADTPYKQPPSFATTKAPSEDPTTALRIVN
jgi:hypothetical protein